MINEYLPLLIVLTALSIIVAIIATYLNQANASIKELSEEKDNLVRDILSQAEEERQKLHDRLMARTLPEYKEWEAPQDNDYDDETEDEVVDIEKVKEEVMGEKPDEELKD